ncbi:MAG: M43 family zinc metalloprotease [Crocinitomicaceae bacterium]|nr:T9SS type A sorting domain-containing protein [Crocinitomicaceae bacterium]
MKKFTLFTALLLSMTAVAQNEHFGPQNPIPCHNNWERDRAFEADPSLRIQDSIDQAEFQSFYEYYYANEYDPGARSTYVVPVVVHICHVGGPENISDEQVYDAIEKLNQDFSATNVDVNTTVAPFDAIIGNADIEFRLATKDPSGNCHKGITRTYTQNTYHDGGSGLRNDVAAEHGTWPQNKYMNVFVCIDPNGAAGYTNNPANWYSATGMGGSIYMRHDYMGTIGTASTTAEHTLSHEVGHWLNLSHCWGGNNNPGQSGACSDDDGVDDTPRTIGWTYCNINGNSCSNDAIDGYWSMDVIDNVQNIMEYSYCSTMFTQGQVARMHSALNSSTAQRNNLWTPANLNATGTNGPGSICEALFSSDFKVVCAGSTVNFTDESYHSVQTRSWTFNGGSPSTSADQNPAIVYNTPGVYTVALSVSDGSSSTSTTQTNYIIVLDTPGVGLPYHEGFEDISLIPDNSNFMVENPAGDQDWSLTTNVGAGGSTHSAILQNYFVTEASKDELISGTIDLSSVDPSDNIVFTFEYAYRKKTSNDDEYLKFYVSADCGETWALRKVIHGNDLSSVNSSSFYTPGTDQDWYFVTVSNINSPYYVSGFRYKFEFTSDGGNNIYIDNINLYPGSMADQEEVQESSVLRVFPNPTEGLTNIQMSAQAGVNYKVTVLSTLGQQVAVIHQGELSNGINNFEFDMTELSRGIYFVKIESEGKVQTVKLIRE